MNIFRTTLLCAVGVLAWNVASAENAATSANPYATISARNAFGLSPPPPPVILPEAEPLPKIRVSGTMTIFGREQVLFKVSNRVNASGAGSEETPCVLAEGEHEAGVEVVKVDETTGIVTFNNHGVEQRIALGDGVSRSRGATSDGNHGF